MVHSRPLHFGDWKLTPRDEEILDSLVHRVRVLSLPQIARTWWNASKAPAETAKIRLAYLERAGLVQIYRALTHPEIQLTIPAANWKPGQRPPDFGPLSYRLKSRWNLPPTSIQCICATRSAGRHFGGSGGRLSRAKEQTHDIHMAAVFLIYRSIAPHLIPKWQSEARINQDREDRRQKLPDAILLLDAGPKVIEFGGAYPKAKLEAFHDYCDENSFPYEVW